MNFRKKFLWIVILFTLAFCLFSCGSQPGDNTPCDEHVDENEDNICDVCEEKIEDTQGNGPREVKLFENGLPVFQFILDSDLPITIRTELYNISKKIKNATGVSVEILPEDIGTPADYEVLIGNVETRGEEYKYDYRKLGPKGQAIEIVGTKIIIAGGSESAFLDLLDVFVEDFLKFDGNDLTEENVTVTEELRLYEPQKSFRITSLSVGDASVKDFSIVISDENQIAMNAAKEIQNAMYTYAGYWLPIVNQSDAQSTENAIVIKVLPKDGVSDGYKLYVDSSSIVFEIMYDNKLLEKVNDFLATIKLKSGDVKLTASTVNKTENIRVISYQDKSFGIDNTGATDASVQIKALHDYANMYGHDVVAGGGKYYIGAGNGSESIIIKTNTDWTGAEFIIDDRNLAYDSDAANAVIIRIDPDNKTVVHNSKSELVQKINAAIEAGEVNFSELDNFFGYEPGYPCLLHPVNNTHKIYIRYGGNANSGNSQQEVILVDAEGNIDKDTPFFFDYSEVTYINEYRVDDTPITIKGGTFTTRANSAPCSYSTGFQRNIEVYRSNVTITGVTHKITDEGDVGTCYEGGFIAFRCCNNVLVEDCVFQAHRMYYDEKVNPDGTITYGTQMGTYEIGAKYSNNIAYKGCTQSNFYDKNGNHTWTWYDENGNTGKNNKGGTASVWGVMGSNYSKNISYEKCILNRFDAHCGVYNAKITETEISSINLIGGGHALIEDCKVYSSAFVNLREDYGSTWKGTVEIVNSELVTSNVKTYVFTGSWYYHDFGFTCYLPNLILDGVTVSSGGNEIYYIDDFAAKLSVDLTPDDGNDEKTEFMDSGVDFTAPVVTFVNKEFENINPIVLPTSITVKNCGDLKVIGAVQPQIEKLIKPLIKYVEE